METAELLSILGAFVGETGLGQTSSCQRGLDRKVCWRDLLEVASVLLKVASILKAKL